MRAPVPVRAGDSAGKSCCGFWLRARKSPPHARGCRT